MNLFFRILFLTIFIISPLLAEARGGGRYSSGKSYSSSSSRLSAVHVRGYTKKNGTYVGPHFRSKANKTKKDNWSHKGNINPYTGKVGTKTD